MIFLGKQINKVVLVDVFTEEERAAENLYVVSQPLYNFFNALEIATELYFPSTREELIHVFETLAAEQGEGLILQLSGHSADTRLQFGNNNYNMEWQESILYFHLINQAWNNGLIINATMMCHSIGLIEAIRRLERPYYAAVAADEFQSQQTLTYNINWYNSSLNRDSALSSILASNDILEDADDIRPFFIDMPDRIWH
jgi:hypothetical protein